MELQSACCSIQAPKIRSSSHQRLLSHSRVSPSFSVLCESPGSHVRFKDRSICVQNASRTYLIAGLKRTRQWSFNKRVTPYASNSNSNSNSNPNPNPNAEEKLNLSEREAELNGVDEVEPDFIGLDEVDPFPGKPGSMSFFGLTHQIVEESKMVSAPFKEGTGSYLWLLAPVVVISSLILPQFFLSSAINAFVKDEVLAEILVPLFSDVMFYIGLAIFLLVTDNVQKPYLEFSSKRWSLITGLNGYLSSTFLTTALKIMAPLAVVYFALPIIGLPALAAVTPFFVGCLIQLAFERRLADRESSSWPLVPIIFEVYRLYQLTKAAIFIERLILLISRVPDAPSAVQSALVRVLVTLQILALVCLWSWLTFLLRLFPSRPVAENY